jgi:hypothetical protein
VPETADSAFTRAESRLIAGLPSRVPGHIPLPWQGHAPKFIGALLGPGIGRHQVAKHARKIRRDGWLGCLADIIGYPGMGRPTVLGGRNH